MSGFDLPHDRSAGDQRIRVLHVLDNLNTGGTELNAVRTGERLDPARFDVRFACLQADGPLRPRLDSAGIPVTELRISSLFGAEAFRRGVELRELIQRDRIHVVHAHDPYSNVLAAPWARLAGRSAVIASHRWWRDVHRRRVRLANRVAYGFAHRVLANSEAVGELVVRDEGVPRNRLVVIPNFVDSGAFTPLADSRRAELRASVGLQQGDFAVGVIANLYPVKNHAMLLRAIALVAREHPNVRAVLVGDGPERDALQRLAASAGVTGNVLLVGRLSHEPGLPGAFEVAALTSREEGFPNFVVEAMAAGLATVATHVGGIPDAIVDGESGLLVQTGDHEALAAAIKRLIVEPAFRARLGHAAAERARSLYHVERVMAAIQSLYEELAVTYGRADQALFRA